MICRQFISPMIIALVFSYAASAAFASEKSSTAFTVPDGFEVSLYADDSLATDIFSLTIDSHGRVVVAGAGYIKILHDTDNDGRADKATLFADLPKSGAHGMVFDGNDLICTGDNGVRRLYDTDGDGKSDKVSPVWFTARASGHAANGVVRGPDGWYYLITGNDGGITRKHITSAASPVKDPNAGVVLRFSPDGKKREVVAHGFRNPYDMAFNSLGDMFTVDADGERIHQMPYYAPNRLFHIAQGMHHGWLLPGWKRGWSRPAYWPDSVERLVEIGRGSPTGVVAYRHRAFPKRYHDGIFSLCWTFGRVYFFPIQKQGSTYAGRKEIFMETTGDIGFAPTDMAIGPNGDLFISIGGRGTRGGVFRVRYKNAPKLVDNDDPLTSVLTADQPLSSWSRATWTLAAKRLGKEKIIAAITNEKLPTSQRIRAVEILTEIFDGVPINDAMVKVWSTDPARELAARIVWSWSRTSNFHGNYITTALATNAKDRHLARIAWESLAALPHDIDPVGLFFDWGTGLNHADRRVRAAALLAAKGPGRRSVLRSLSEKSRKPTLRERLAKLWVEGPPAKDARNMQAYWETCLDVLVKSSDPSVSMEAVRLMQLALGDVETDEGKIGKAFVGYVAHDRDRMNAKLRQTIARRLAEVYPTYAAVVDTELARLLGMLAQDVTDLPEWISRKWTDGTTTKSDIHYLLVFSQLPGKRLKIVTERTAYALANLHIKGPKPTDQVPQILEDVFKRLLKHDPHLADALVHDPSFGVPGHELFANQLPLAAKRKAARRLLKNINALDEDQARLAWGPELVRLVAALPDSEALPILHKQFADPRLSDSITLILAKKRAPDDRQRFISALNSTQPNIVRTAAEALLDLTKRDTKATPLEIGKAVRALRRMSLHKSETKTQQALTTLLNRWTNKAIGINEKNADAWVQWFLKTHPKSANAIPGLAVANLATWKQRLSKIDWTTGDVKRGELVFGRKNCFRCHGDARRLGPDLHGVAQRFSRSDLFTAIIDPNKDISPAYRPTAVVTKSGKLYSGVMIYTSPALTLLQTTPDTTVRIAQDELLVMQPSTTSFMPAGLLDELGDGDLADLYAYLEGLRKR